MIPACLVALLAVFAPVWPQQTPASTPVEQPKRPTASDVGDLEALTARNPDDPKGWVLLGLAYLDRNEDPRALDAFQRAVKAGPGSAEAHNWLGVALAAKSDMPGALAEFRKAVELDPQYGRAYSNLGSTLAQSGDYATRKPMAERTSPHATG